jgi:dihydropteroate synthase
MGILNVTPDSFYDGGQFEGVERALERARAMAREGADIIDIGGESTGPGSGEVSIGEELRRVIPTLKSIKYQVVSIKLSVDTYKAEVARAALDAGAEMINDVTAGRGDRGMFALMAEMGCDYVMMRSKDDSPRTTKKDVQYDDVVKTIHEFFEERISQAEKAGVKREKIILDPGLGHFVSSDPKYSFEILERLEEISDLGCRILVSPSRKSFTAGPTNLPPEKRLENTLAATKLAIEHGASMIRTHDVKETKKLIRQMNLV